MTTASEKASVRTIIDRGVKSKHYARGEVGGRTCFWRPTG